MSESSPTRRISTWEKNLLGVKINELPQLIPGLFAVAILTWLSFWLSNLIGVRWMGFDKSPISPVLVAIILGMAIGTAIPLPKSLTPGLQFSIKKILRFGIILLGIRLTIFDVFKLGAFGVPIVSLGDYSSRPGPTTACAYRSGLER
jgi:uncharacterized membrane protein YadS